MTKFMITLLTNCKIFCKLGPKLINNYRLIRQFAQRYTLAVVLGTIGMDWRSGELALSVAFSALTLLLQQQKALHCKTDSNAIIPQSL